MAPGVLPDGLQQHEAACGAIRPAMHDEVLRDEPREDREGRLRDGAFGLDRAATGEHGERREHGPLCGRKLGVAPLQRRFEGR